MNFGFVSTRFAGTDGVSLESLKWSEVLEEAGHAVFWFAGLSDRPDANSHVVPEAHFAHPDIARINGSVWGSESVDSATAAQVGSLRKLLRSELEAFVGRFEIDVLIPQNAVTIPMNPPLGLAIADFIRETRIPTIAHHHDFHWERDRFTGAAAVPWLGEAFPPRLPGMAHAVIHSGAREELRRRFGIEAVLVPNVMPFEREAPPPHLSRETVRHKLGLGVEDRLILQPTRVVPRKGIELAIELLERLGDPRNHLVVSHEAGDEGLAYRDALVALAREKRVPIQFLEPDGGSVPNLGDLYHAADLVSFPSLFEGFGNALLEAVWYEKPVFVNRYPVYQSDIEPLGFRFTMIDGEVTEESVAEVRTILDDPASVKALLRHNRELAAAHFGFTTLRDRLGELLGQLGLRL